MQKTTVLTGVFKKTLLVTPKGEPFPMPKSLEAILQDDNIKIELLISREQPHGSYKITIHE